MIRQLVAVLLWETAERTLRAGPWRHQLLRRVVLPDRWALAGLDNGSKALAANITTGIIAAAQQLQQIQQQQEAEEAVRKREEEFAARQQRVNECRGWQGANTGLDGADEGWRWLAGLRAGVLDAASGAASDARDKGGNALKQAVASRLAQLIKNRSSRPRGRSSRGKLPLRGLWQRWLEDAAGRLPRRHAAAFGCSPAHVELLRQACTAGNETSLYARQHLFSIHIHSPPSFAQDYEEGSIFKGRTVYGRPAVRPPSLMCACGRPPSSTIHLLQLACRINPAWGSHDLVEAQRLLYRDALLDPLVQRLMMVSESCAPLYPAPVVWAQAVREGKSRVDACRPGANVAERGGADLWGSVLRPELWRKSSQWSMLQLILRDEELNALFARHCYVGWRPLGGGYRTCTSDEHYLPTTLAYYNRSAECHCTSQNSSQDGVSYVEWTTTSAVDGHPASFGGGDVNISEAVGSIDSAFVDAADWTQETCEAVRAKEKLPIEPVKLAEGGWRCVGGTHWSPKKDGRCCTADEKECNVAPSPQERRPDFGIAGFKPLPGGQCALLGRKFREDAVEALLGLASECGKDEVPVFGTWGCPVAGKKKDGKGGGADGSESSKAQQGGDGEGQGGQNGGGGGSASSSEERKDGNEEQKGGTTACASCLGYPGLLLQVRWHAFLLAPEREQTGSARELEHRIRQAGADVGAAFSGWEWTPATLKGHALVAAARKLGKDHEANELLFRATYEEGEDVSKLGTLERIGQQLGLSDVRAALESDELLDEVVQDDHTGKEHLHVTGVPCFFIKRPRGHGLRLEGAQHVKAFKAELRKGSRQAQLEAEQWLVSALAALVVTDRGTRRRRFAQFLPGGSAARRAEHAPLARALLGVLLEAAPARVGTLLAREPALLCSFFRGQPSCVAAWFGAFSMGGLREFKHGAYALARYALARRAEMWDLLVWDGRHAQAPVAVAQRTHYFCELDIQATMDKVIRRARCPEFWDSQELREAVADGSLLALDPGWWCDELLGWLGERSARSDALYDVVCDFVEADASWRQLCQRLLPLLPRADLLAFATGLLEEGPYVSSSMASSGSGSVGSAGGPGPAAAAPGAWLVLRGVAWGSLDELVLASAAGCSLGPLARTLQEEEHAVEGRYIQGLVAQLHAVPAAAHWALRRQLLGLLQQREEAARREQQEAGDRRQEAGTSAGPAPDRQHEQGQRGADEPAAVQLHRLLLLQLLAAGLEVQRAASSSEPGSAPALAVLLAAGGLACEPAAAAERMLADSDGGRGGKRDRKRKRSGSSKKRRKERHRRRSAGSDSDESGSGGDDSQQGDRSAVASSATDARWSLQLPGQGSAPSHLSSLELVGAVQRHVAACYADWRFSVSCGSEVPCRW
eukprot:scaffold6.g2843.t1